LLLVRGVGLVTSEQYIEHYWYY